MFLLRKSELSEANKMFFCDCSRLIVSFPTVSDSHKCLDIMLCIIVPKEPNLSVKNEILRFFPSGGAVSVTQSVICSVTLFIIPCRITYKHDTTRNPKSNRHDSQSDAYGLIGDHCSPRLMP